jgi:hypothetical protein
MGKMTSIGVGATDVEIFCVNIGQTKEGWHNKELHYFNSFDITTVIILWMKQNTYIA